jgi:hypothetical protein
VTGRTLYLDMDGVLANFDKGMEEATGSTNIYKYEFVYGAKAFWDALNSVQDFFLHLELMPDAAFLFNMVRPLKPKVLTAIPKSNSDSVRWQKHMWCAENLGDDVEVVTCLTHEKPDYCKPGDVLIDDRNINANAWRERGGIFVLHTDARSSVEQLLAHGVI